MTAEPLDDRAQERTDCPEDEERYVELDTADGLIIYDRHNHSAWVQSSATVAVGERR